MKTCGTPQAFDAIPVVVAKVAWGPQVTRLFRKR
jgi:hypothetical protein